MAAADDPRRDLLLSHVEKNGAQLGSRLGEQLKGSAKEAAGKFAKEWPGEGESPDAVLAKCTKCLELMADLRDLYEAARQIYRVFLPSKISLEALGKPAEEFEVVDLDDEGRPVYRQVGSETVYLRWHKREKGALWAAHTDKEGKAPGDAHLDNPLPIDSGEWSDPETGKALQIQCRRASDTVLEPAVAKRLEQAWADPGLSVEKVCEASQSALEGSALGSKKVPDGRTVLEAARDLLEAMCKIAKKLNLQGSSPVHPSGNATWAAIFSALRSLAPLAEHGFWPKLQGALPFFTKECDLSWVHCLIYMCRVLDVSDIRVGDASSIPRLCNRLFLRGWQESESAKGKFMVVDIPGASAKVQEPGMKLRGGLRCVAVSDTHGWDGDLRLPMADVLLHSGDILFEGSALGADKAVPADLKHVMNVFKRAEYQRYRWIFLIGGNHDSSLHKLWAGGEKAVEDLRNQLPKNLVLLQVPSDKMDPKLPNTCLMADKGTQDLAQDGAMKVLPNLELAKPSDPRPGWVVVGSGVSLANNAWSANKAFQLIKTDTEALEAAANVLLKHSPDIVLTHGPPKGHLDGGGRGDEKLASAIASSDSVQLHIFGHVHETAGAEFGDGGKCYVNATMSSPLYVAASFPLLVDVPLKRPPLNQVPMRALKMRVPAEAKITEMDVLLHFAGFFVPAVAIIDSGREHAADVAFVYFDDAEEAARALDTLSPKELATSRWRGAVTLQAWEHGEKGFPRNTKCLFDIINKSHPGQDLVSQKDLDDAKKAGILPYFERYERLPR